MLGKFISKNIYKFRVVNETKNIKNIVEKYEKVRVNIIPEITFGDNVSKKIF